VQGSVDSRSAFGGTAPARVREQLEMLSEKLGESAAWSG
jgi:argininosuccinate lyase